MNGATMLLLCSSPIAERSGPIHGLMFEMAHVKFPPRFKRKEIVEKGLDSHEY
jgi:hypothetical protein